MNLIGILACTAQHAACEEQTPLLAIDIDALLLDEPLELVLCHEPVTEQILLVDLLADRFPL